MLVQTFQMGIIEADFFINQEQIAEELCENKALPELNCLGNCQLKKELEKNDESSQRKHFNELSPFIAVITLQTPQPITASREVKNPWTIPFRATNFVDDIFHPPAGISII